MKSCGVTNMLEEALDLPSNDHRAGYFLQGLTAASPLVAIRLG